MLSFGLNILNAQNTALFDVKENITNGGLKKILPKELNDNFDADKYFDKIYENFVSFHIYNRNIDINSGFLPNYFSSCMLPQMPNNFDSEGYVNWKDSIESQKYLKLFEEFQISKKQKFEKIKKIMLSDKNIYEVVYNFLIAFYKNGFSKMTNGETKDFLKTIDEAIDYTEKFDLEKEIADEQKMKSAFAYKKGKIKAFIYRRIRNKEFTKEECLSWLKRIYGDLKSAVIKKSGIEDYIILEKIFNNYYKGRIYDSLSNSTFFVKVEKEFQFLDNNTKIIEYTFKKNAKNYSPDLQIKLISKSVSVTEFKNYIHGLGDSVLNFKSSKLIKEITPVYGNNDEFMNYFLLNYEDNTIELLNINDGALTSFGTRLKTEIKIENGIYMIYFSDGSSDFLHITNESYLINKSFNSEIEKLSVTANPNEYLMQLKSGETYLLRKNFSEFLKLASNYKYESITYWKSKIIFSQQNTNGKNKYGVLNSDGTLFQKPFFDDFNIPSSESDFILLGNGGFYAYDSTFTKLHSIFFPIIVVFDPETFEESFFMDRFNSKDKTIILSSIGKEEVSYDVLLDSKGKILIPDKWSQIERFEIEGFEHNLYKVKDKPNAGKWALFDYRGKQLSKFLYDNIIFYQGMIIANIKGRNIFLDKNGRLSRKTCSEYVSKIKGSEIYCFYFTHNDFALVDNKSLLLSKSVYGYITTENLFCNSDLNEELSLYKKDNNMLIYKYKPMKEQNIVEYELDNIGYIENQYQVLIDSKGKELIDKNTVRIILPNSEHDLYKVNQYFECGSDMKNQGKLAVYNHKGKALSKFVYDSIANQPDENGLIKAVRNGKNVLINANGKEAK